MDDRGRLPPETMPRPPPRAPIPDEELFAPGITVDHFKIQRLIGKGGMGEVYLARDTRLGRRVAIKVLRSETLGSREAVDRFLHEARTTARFSHPHIVTIHHVGERQGSPYVALEYLEGRSLRDRLEDDPPKVAETMRIGLAVAEALADAHRHHVLHRDLKPENVMLPRDGRLRVVDFGLAKALEAGPVSDTPHQDGGGAADAPLTGAPQETQAERAHGSPGYMAPEQWQEQTVTPAVDLWALGVVLWEMLHGRHPYEGITDLFQLCHVVTDDEPVPPVTAEAPEALVDLVQRCVDKDPVGRPSAEQAAEVLRELLNHRRSLGGAEVAPFRGLLPFRERHADQFHGREGELAAFLERVRERPVLPVVGPSGTGKSSFVQAGVIPRLREQGRWLVFRVRPGRHPMRALAERLYASTPAVAASQPSFPTFDHEGNRSAEAPSTPGGDDSLRDQERTLTADLRESPKRLALRLSEIAEREAPARVLLFVDQLEELYTQVDDEELRRLWLEAICSAADDPDGPVRVIFTVRDDFLGPLTESSAAREALSHVTVLGVPGADALQAILREPVRDAGYTFDDDALVDEMVHAVEGEPAALPLLQFTGESLWELRDREHKQLRRADLEAIGGVAGALARHADGVLEGLSASQLRTARELLLRFVSEGGARRVLPFVELPQRRPEEVAYVLERLVQARLVLVREGRDLADSVSGAYPAEFELVHESLIQRWDQLARWLEESREERAFLTEVGQAAALWHRRGRRPEELWQGDALHDARRTCTRLGLDLPERSQAFLDEAGRHEARKAQRSRNITIGVIALSVAVALVTTLLALVARREGDHAREQQRLAEVERAVAQREGARAAWTRGDVLEARAKLRGSLETVDSPLARALWWQLSREPLRWHTHLGATVYGLDVSPDGRWIAAGLQDGTVHLVDAVTREAQPLRGLRDPVQAVAFSPDGSQLACGTYGGELALWTVADLDAPILVDDAHAGFISVLRYAPDGGALASASRDGTVGLWDPATGQRIRTLEGGGGRVHDALFSSTGAWLATGDRQGVVILWDPATGERLLTLEGHEKAVHRLAFAPDGSWLASSSWDDTTRLWDLPGGELRAVLRGHEERVTAVVVHPDGDRLFTSSNDRTVRVWSTRDGRELEVLRGHDERIGGLVLSPDGTQLASRADDATIRLWDLDGGGPPRALEGHTASIMRIRFSPDGAKLYSGGNDHELRAWATEVERVEPPQRGHGAMVTALDLSADGAVAASASLDQTVVLWDLDSGQPLTTLRGQDDGQLAVALSPDGGAVSAGGIDGVIRVWAVPSGTLRWVLEGHGAPVHDLAYLDGGQILVSASGDHTVRTWDLATGEPLRVLRDHAHYLTAMSLSPDGRWMATGTNDGRVAVWDVAGWRIRHERTSPAGHIWGLRFTPDGERVVFAGDDGTLRVWEPATGAEVLSSALGTRLHMLGVDPTSGRIGLPCADGLGVLLEPDGTGDVVLRGHRGSVNRLMLLGDRVVSAGDDGTVRSWDPATGQPRWNAPCLLPDPPELRTHEGWFAADGSLREGGAAEAWRTAVADRARYAEATAGRTRLCLEDHGGALEIWDPAADQRLGRAEISGLRRVAAAPDGCLTLDGEGVVRLHREGATGEELVRGATTLAVAGDEVLVATGEDVRIYGPSGQETARLDADIDSTAVGRLGSRVAVGYREGSIEVLDGDGGVLRMEDVPASAVVRLAPGPEGTLLAGFGDGSFGVWSLDNGRALHRAKLHGAVVHLQAEGEVVHAATELGDHLALHLDAFHLDYCALLGDVWADVPVAWQDGRPVAAPRPTDHPCSTP